MFWICCVTILLQLVLVGLTIMEPAEEAKEMFDYLKGYSPVHNVKAGAKYPATMVTTGDHDDRVVPAHSFKFAAELQAKQTGTKSNINSY